jgi:hypothetical protein
MRPRRIPALWLRMNVEIRTRRATGAACWETIIHLGRTFLSRRGSRNTEGVNKFKFGRKFFGERESRNRSGRLHGHLRGGLWNGRVSNVADLAMILVVRVGVPVADRMRRERSQRQNGRDGQQTSGESFRDVRLEVHVEDILPYSHGDGPLQDCPCLIPNWPDNRTHSSWDDHSAALHETQLTP